MISAASPGDKAPSAQAAKIEDDALRASPAVSIAGSSGQHFWARGYFVSTVGRDTEVIREYINKQEEEDKRLEQMNLWR